MRDCADVAGLSRHIRGDQKIPDNCLPPQLNPRASTPFNTTLNSNLAVAQDDDDPAGVTDVVSANQNVHVCWRVGVWLNMEFKRRDPYDSVLPSRKSECKIVGG
jgi:hypothetical protein